MASPWAYGLFQAGNSFMDAYNKAHAQAQRNKFEQDQQAQQNFERTRQYNADQDWRKQQIASGQEQDARQARLDMENRNQFLASNAPTPEARVQVYQEGMNPGSQHISVHEPGVGGRPGVMVDRQLQGPDAQAQIMKSAWESAHALAQRQAEQKLAQQMALKQQEEETKLQTARISAGAGSATALTKGKLANQNAIENEWYKKREAESDPAKKAAIDAQFRQLGGKRPLPSPVLNKNGSQPYDWSARGFEGDLQRLQSEINHLESSGLADPDEIEARRQEMFKVQQMRDAYMKQKRGAPGAQQQVDPALFNETLQRINNSGGDHRKIEAAIQQLANTHNMDPNDVAKLFLGE